MLLVVSWILSFGILFPHAQAAGENPLIRVRLESSLQKLELDGLGAQISGREDRFQLVALPRQQKITITRESMQGHSIWKVQRNSQIEIVTEKFLALRASDLRRGGKSLPNQIFLAPQKNNQFDVIGVLPLENYIVGVLASEMPLNWPLETLKAQAIAARSYAMVTMKERSRQIYHVESSILDQVFSHIGSGPDESPLVAKAKEAVRQTEGMVLLEKPQKVLKAYYHSDCGGKTSSSKSVWGFGSSVGSTVDEGCPSNPKAHWNLEISQGTLSERIQNFIKRTEFGLVESLNLIRPSRADRVERVRVAWASGDQTILSAQDFRAAVGYDQMRSTFFETKRVGSEFQFSGAGFGHGVGLCQWGARYLGKQGKSFTEILSHYYPQAQVQPWVIRTQQRLEAQIR
jgi:stage II sporulation protein D